MSPGLKRERTTGDKSGNEEPEELERRLPGERYQWMWQEKWQEIAEKG